MDRKRARWVLEEVARRNGVSLEQVTADIEYAIAVTRTRVYA